jgi:hypothetical protein
MNWCCAQFEGWHSQSGQRGLGVFVKRSLDESKMFVLQHRAADPGVIVTTEPLAPVSLITDIGIQYCPWCGVRLEKWYGKNTDRLERTDLGVRI